MAQHQQVAIIVVGSTMIDMMAYVDRVPAAGETVVGRRFVQGFGGKGANQAVMASRLGAAVVIVNCLGDDVFGDMTLDNLTNEGIDVSAITRAAGVSSGVAPIWVEPDGTNRIIVVPGANERLRPAQATAAVAAAAALDVVVGQLEVPQQVTAAAFAAARDRRAVTVLNPAPAAALSPGLVDVTDWLVPNEVEFAALADGAGSAGAGLGDASIAALAKRTGTGLAVTLGADGAAICPAGTAQVTRVAAPPVQAVDTTGAGDAFVGGFAFGLASGWSPMAAAELGCRCASDSVTRPGTQTSYPSGEELARLVAESQATVR